MPGGARLLEYAAADPAWNMAVDEALVRHATEPTLRLYGWDPPAISLGRFQKASDPELAALLGAGLPVVRRMTGGGAIVHWHELTYSLTLPDTHDLVACSTEESYAGIHAPIQRALAAVGVTSSSRTVEAARSDPALCFHRVTSLDLVVGGLKLVGSAQRRTDGRVLQHGSIVLASNRLQPGTAALDDLLPTSPSAAGLAEQLAAAFAIVLGGLRSAALTDTERAHADKAAPGYRFC